MQKSRLLYSKSLDKIIFLAFFTFYHAKNLVVS